MTDADFNDYLSMPDTAKTLKMPRRTLYRIIDRLGVDKVVTRAFGRRVIHRSFLPMIKAEHAVPGSKRRREIAKLAGHKGGTAKARNAARAARAAKREGV